MAGFDAGNAVEPMDWDFTKFGGGKGTIAEPSDVEMERFLRKYRTLMGAVRDEALASLKQSEEESVAAERSPVTLEEAKQLMAEIDLTEEQSEFARRISEQMLDIVCSITKDSPSREQIGKLPNRIRGAFYGWLVGQLTDPDFVQAADTRPSLSLVNGG